MMNDYKRDIDGEWMRLEAYEKLQRENAELRARMELLKSNYIEALQEVIDKMV